MSCLNANRHHRHTSRTDLSIGAGVTTAFVQRGVLESTKTEGSRSLYANDRNLHRLKVYIWNVSTCVNGLESIKRVRRRRCGRLRRGSGLLGGQQDATFGLLMPVRVFAVRHQGSEFSGCCGRLSAVKARPDGSGLGVRCRPSVCLCDDLIASIHVSPVFAADLLLRPTFAP